jgi:hypothetical protein
MGQDGSSCGVSQDEDLLALTEITDAEHLSRSACQRRMEIRVEVEHPRDAGMVNLF